MSRKQDEQVITLNSTVKTKIAPSKIHGVGVFALRDITKGETVYARRESELFTLPYSCFGKLFPEIKQTILEGWPSVINGSYFLSPVCLMISFMNHDKDCNYDQENDTAKVLIPAGTEITEDYTLMEGFEKVYPWLKKVV